MMEKTAFNVTGFIQPAFVYEVLNHVPDADGWNDRPTRMYRVFFQKQDATVQESPW